MIHVDGLRRRLRGRLDYRVFRGEECTEHVGGPNLAVANVYQVMIDLLGGEVGGDVAEFGVGTNGTAPALGDTTLTDLVLVAVQAITFPAAMTVAFDWVIDRETANGLLIREFGLFTTSGALVARKTRAAAIEKTEVISLEGTWTIHF